MGSRFEFTSSREIIARCGVLIWSLINLSDWDILQSYYISTNDHKWDFYIYWYFHTCCNLMLWTIQGIEVANIFTDGREMSQYPLDIYKNG